MQAGKLRRLVTIESVTETPNEYGEPEQVWAEFAQAWAQQEDLTGREAFLAQQVLSEVTTRFTIRYVAGVTAKMRVVSDDTIYNIQSVADPDGKRRSLVLMALRYE